jgi:hypothetical protein
VIDIHALAAGPTKTGFVLLADRNGFAIRMISTLQRPSPFVLDLSRHVGNAVHDAIRISLFGIRHGKQWRLFIA